MCHGKDFKGSASLDRKKIRRYQMIPTLCHWADTELQQLWSIYNCTKSVVLRGKVYLHSYFWYTDHMNDLSKAYLKHGLLKKAVYTLNIEYYWQWVFVSCKMERYENNSMLPYLLAIFAVKAKLLIYALHKKCVFYVHYVNQLL